MRKLRFILAPALLLVLASCAEKHAFRDINLPIEERVELLMAELTLDEKIGMICTSQPAIERLGIPAYDWWSECLHGVARAGQATVFPKPICLGSAWDENLTRRVAAAIADEARAKHHATLREKGYTERYEGLTFFSPTVNMVRDPRWGRTVECYSEDPYMMGRLASAFVQGLQGDDPNYLKLAATVKHFVANNEEDRRLDGSAEVDMTSLREYYLPPYLAAIREADVTSVMAAYNALNGVPCTANPWLLTDLLRDEWGFEGVTISDGSALDKLVTHQHYAATRAEAGAMALKAGCDMALRNEYKTMLPEALEQGLITEADIDAALRRALAVRFRLGMFDPPGKVPYIKTPLSVVESEAHRALAVEAAAGGMILLKNEGEVLPLQKDRLKRVALIGEACRKVHYGDYSAEPLHNLTLLEAVQAELEGVAEVVWVTDQHHPELIAAEYYVRPDEYAAEGLIGLTSTYYDNASLTGEPFTTRHDHVINFDLTSRRSSDLRRDGLISVRWHTNLVPPRTGDYLITMEGGNGAFGLQIAGEPAAVLSAGQESYRVRMEQGKKYDLLLEGRDMGPEAHVKLLWQEVFPDDTPSPAELAAAADAAIVFIRDAGGSEGSDRKTLEVDPRQVELARSVAEANPNTVVLFGCSTALILTDLDDAAPALLNVWIAGQGEAQAASDILFGKRYPSGRTPVTFFADQSKLPPMDDYDVTHGRTYQYTKGNVLFPLGYGLGYTTFEYGYPDVPAVVEQDGKLSFSLTVRNRGERDGAEVVQCYVTRDSWQAEGLSQKLIAFRRVPLKAGERNRVTFEVDTRELARWNDARGAWEIEPGDYTLKVGYCASITQDIPFRVAGGAPLQRPKGTLLESLKQNETE